MPADQEYSIGQVVVLKSGGPLMTVVAVGVLTVSCRWFFGDGLNDSDFANDSVELPTATPSVLQGNNVWTDPNPT